MNRGFTLFFAMLVASLTLAIGLAVYDLTVRELDLSATTVQSQYAIYAADTGVECALYWDNKYSNGSTNNNGGSNSAFATSSLDTTPAPSGVLCNSVDVAAVGTPPSPVVLPQTSGNGWTTWSLAETNIGTTYFATTTFYITFSPQPYCTQVQVGKTGNPPQTLIISHGYNTCNSGGLQLERVLQVSY